MRRSQERHLLRSAARSDGQGVRAMRFVLFYHSLVSDWNHPAAHFLRGVATRVARHTGHCRAHLRARGWLEPAQSARAGRRRRASRHSTRHLPAPAQQLLRPAERWISMRRWPMPTSSSRTSGTTRHFLRRLGEHRAAQALVTSCCFTTRPHRVRAGLPPWQVRETRAVGTSTACWRRAMRLRRVYEIAAGLRGSGPGAKRVDTHACFRRGAA